MELFGFYRQLELMRDEVDEDMCFTELFENILVGHGNNLDNYLHGRCDEFAAGLSDVFGYKLECLMDSDNCLIHAYCVAESGAEKFYIDARGITTDDELFFDEFADFCTYSPEEIYDLGGNCSTLYYKDTSEMYGDKNWKLLPAFNDNKDVIEFLKKNVEYYDVQLLGKECCRISDDVFNRPLEKSPLSKQIQSAEARSAAQRHRQEHPTKAHEH